MKTGLIFFHVGRSDCRPLAGLEVFLSTSVKASLHTVVPLA